MNESAGGEPCGWVTQQDANEAHSFCISHDTLKLVKRTSEMLMRAVSMSCIVSPGSMMFRT